MSAEKAQDTGIQAESANDWVEVSDSAHLVDQPLVSVLMITYNHAEYLAEAIESIVSQRCDFPFELIIGEDASTDETRSIALSYQKKYPGLIRVIYSARNVGMNHNARRILPCARGEFLAYCEGDDYWCSIDKLNSQVALIRGDECIGAVHTDWVSSRKVGGDWVVDWKKPAHRRTPVQFLEGNIFHTFHYPRILRTCTMLVRATAAVACEESPLRSKEYRFGDTVYTAFIASRWKVAYLPSITAVYRISHSSVLRSGDKARVAYLRSCLEFDTDARDFFSDRDDYPEAFRLEQAVGLSLWAIKARDLTAFLAAWRDIWTHFSFLEFITTGAKAVLMRCPSLRRQPRAIPYISAEPTRTALHK